jgi:hypothetical protein
MAEVSGTDVFEVTYKKADGYTVTFSPEGEKSETTEAVTYKFTAGTKVKATIAASDGYQIVSLKANGIALSDAVGKKSYVTPELEINTSLVIAVEKSKTALITINASELFSYEFKGVDKDNKAVIGSQVTLKIIPSEGYKVTKILYNGKEVTPGNEYTFTVGEANAF